MGRTDQLQLMGECLYRFLLKPISHSWDVHVTYCNDVNCNSSNVTWCLFSATCLLHVWSLMHDTLWLFLRYFMDWYWFICRLAGGYLKYTCNRSAQSLHIECKWYPKVRAVVVWWLALLPVMRKVHGSIPTGGFRILHDFQGAKIWLSTTGIWSIYKCVAVCLSI